MATAAVMFGTLGPVTRLAYDQGVSPLGFATWRATFGAVVVGVIVALSVARGRRLTGVRSLPRRAQASLTVATLTGIVLNLALFGAFGRVTVALALLVFFTYPAMVTLTITVRDRARPDRIQLAALAMALLGMAVVVLGSLDPGNGLTLDPLGLGLALLAAVIETVFILVSRRGYGGLPSDESVLVILAGDALGFVAIAVVTGNAAELVDPMTSSGAWPYLLFAGIFSAGIATTLFISGVRRIGGVRTSILAMIEPVTGTILAALILGEAIRPVQALGGGLVLMAGILLQRSPVTGGRHPDASAAGTDDALVETVPLV